MQTVLVTGAAGFIGSSLVRMLMEDADTFVVALDLLTYAGSMENLPAPGQNFRFQQGDIGDASLVRGLFTQFGFQQVINCAAETHVDRSIHDPAAFLRTNVMGTFTLLEICREFWSKVPGDRAGFRFHHVSTDEVYGSLLPGEAPFSEESKYDPSSPYSASKAAADHLVRAYGRTYGLPISISNCSNNYGPRQYPEKLLPVAILACLEEQPIPVYGDGGQRRDWLYVHDHCQGILDVIRKGSPGATYNFGGAWEATNLEVLNKLCEIMDVMKPGGDPCKRLITFVKDRPGHDRRYAIDATKAQRELGWSPKVGITEGLELTIAWYLGNLSWVERLKASGSYKGWISKNYSARGNS